MAEKNKKKKGRRAYLDDFQTTVSGEMIYCGAYYGFQGGDRARRRFLLKLAAASAVAAVFSVLSGCVPAPGTLNCFYVLLPLLGSILSAVSVLWAVIRLIAGGEEKLTAVCLESGFSDYRYFSAAFKKQFGMTPEQYKFSLKKPENAVIHHSIHSLERFYTDEQSKSIIASLWG